MTVLDLLDAETRRSIASLARSSVPRGTVLFRPGDEPGGFLLVTDGVIDVYLVGRSGREMLLYEVGSGQTCIQTTLCLLGRQPYSGEAVARTDASFVMVPKHSFAELLAGSEAFRGFVFGAFGNRLKEVMGLLEKVAFVRVEARLAGEILRRADGSDVAAATHQELATAIGSVREVISRRLEALEKAGLVRLERGRVAIVDRARLAGMARDAG
jgi:CRP/FNR family transcriptional regulator